MCGNWTGPIVGLNVNHKFYDKLRSELSDHRSFHAFFHQSHASVFLVVYLAKFDQKHDILQQYL
jgi:hypothetical protein